MDELIVPGPTMSSPVSIFFRNGDDLWQLSSGEPAQRVTRGLRLGPFAAAPDGSRVAVVVLKQDGPEQTQEIRIIGVDGSVQATLAGPEPAEPAIVGLSWSSDGALLAVARSNGSITALSISGDPPPEDLAQAPAGQLITDVQWAPNIAGIAWLSSGAAAGSSLWVAPRGAGSVGLIDAGAVPSRAARSFSWLPGRGRIAWVEGDSATSSAPTSIFTMPPDGSSRELLISAGRFAPVASIDDLLASPDGQRLAFSVFTPDARGNPAFASLWVLNIDSGELLPVPVAPGYRVTDLWWINIGLVWRGVDLAAPIPEDPTEYAGTEPFVLGIFSFDTNLSTVVFQSKSPGG